MIATVAAAESRGVVGRLSLQVKGDKSSHQDCLSAFDPVPVGKNPTEHCQAWLLAPAVWVAPTAIHRSRFFEAAGYQGGAKIDPDSRPHDALQH
jgi:hypothetical protein